MLTLAISLGVILVALAAILAAANHRRAATHGARSDLPCVAHGDDGRVEFQWEEVEGEWAPHDE